MIEKNLWNSRLKAKIFKIFEISRTIYSNREGQNNFWWQNAFLTCSWRFLRSNRLGQLEFKLEKIIGIEKHAGKVRKWKRLIMTFDTGIFPEFLVPKSVPVWYANSTLFKLVKSQQGHRRWVGRINNCQPRFWDIS